MERSVQTEVILLVFNAVVLALGIIVLIWARKMSKSGKIPDLFLNDGDLKRLKKGKTEKDFAKALFPSTVIFGAIDLAFGIEGFLSPVLKFPYIVDLLMLGIFLAGWVGYSAKLRSLKGEYISFS